MMKIVAVVALLAVSAMAITEKEYRTSFLQFIKEHNKQYSATEFAGKYAVFKQNMDFVEAWNKNPEAHRVAINHMADLTVAEYSALYLGTHIVKENATYVSSVGLDVPASIDWRTKGAVTGIKNQGQCGSCWAFSAVGSTEGVHFQKTKTLVSLSEQNLVDCSSAEGNQGCNGGLMDQAFKYIISNKGIDTEASYAYTAVTGTCEFKAANVGATLKGFEDIPSGSESGLVSSIVGRPTSVAIDASHSSFQFYKTGVYYEPACSTSQLDHGVLAVGYGADAGKDYYIVKNSWGTIWGQEGYIWMARNHNNNCGIATSASYPTA